MEYSATGNLGSIVSITESRLGSSVQEVHQPWGASPGPCNYKQMAY